MDIEKIHDITKEQRQLPKETKSVSIYSTHGGDWLVMLSNKSRCGVNTIIGKCDTKAKAIRLARRASNKTYGPANVLEDKSMND